MREESINLDDLDDINEEPATAQPFVEDSALIRCGRYLGLQARKRSSDKALPCGQIGESTELSCIEDDLTEDQKRYIDLVATGMTSIMACQTMGVDIFLPTLWEETLDKDCTFMQCMQLVKRKQADLLEENVWDQAINNPKSTILKMFALKARKDEYKDNAPPQTNLQTNIYVTVDNMPYDVNVAIQDTRDTKNG